MITLLHISPLIMQCDDPFVNSDENTGDTGGTGSPTERQGRQPKS
jgi:hypothetical protein